ncbi:neurotensin/neuromedin N-like [Scleropages formosus]|uniref:neurotensin/neuromedin N-like n=1 Tax=Scleropages formosus TaxID=113540 RepID=UPI0008789A31|nr:neurotensin/neuromedin N [Scleropages formosus]
MRTQLVCVVLLFVVCCAMCSAHAEEEEKVAGGELMRWLLASEVSGQDTIHWRVMLLWFCGLLHSHLEEDVNEWEPTLEELHSIQNLCWTLQPRRSDPDVREPGGGQNADDSNGTLRRKTPYILKRQLYNTKARRPYILKRSPGYLAS